MKYIKTQMENKFKNFVGATAPRLPCISPYCKHCDSHTNLKNETKETNLVVEPYRPALNWINDLPSGLLPHMSYCLTPPRF
jgi:hypothetical protein